MSNVMKKVVVLAVIAALTVASTSSALATWSRGVDDTCGTGYAPYFWAEGPANYWYTSSGGVSNCHMWTTTVPESLNPVNIAHWYTDPSDPAGSGSAVANMTGTDNSCGYVYYMLQPSGENGSVSWSYVSQAGPASTYVFTGVSLVPSFGAKLALPDNQPCATGQTLMADYVLWSEP